MKTCSNSLLMGKLQIKTSMRYSYTAEELKFKRLTTSSVDKDVGQLEGTYTAHGSINWWEIA